MSTTKRDIKLETTKLLTIRSAVKMYHDELEKLLEANNFSISEDKWFELFDYMNEAERKVLKTL